MMIEEVIKPEDAKRFAESINNFMTMARNSNTASESYERLADELENQMILLEEREKHRLSVSNALINILLRIRQMTSDLAQVVETENIAETFNGFSKEINKLILGITIVGERVNQTQDMYNSFREGFAKWRRATNE